MQRRSGFALVALVALALIVTGCDLAGFRVQIPDFASRQVDGIWVWRQMADGGFERLAQLEFGQPTAGADGTQYLPYALREGDTQLMLSAVVEAVPGQPSAVTLELGFLHPMMGTFKVSSYNAAGESVLSAGTLVY